MAHKFKKYTYVHASPDALTRTYTLHTVGGVPILAHDMHTKHMITLFHSQLVRRVIFDTISANAKNAHKTYTKHTHTHRGEKRDTDGSHHFSERGGQASEPQVFKAEQTFKQTVMPSDCWWRDPLNNTFEEIRSTCVKVDVGIYTAHRRTENQSFTLTERFSKW